MIFNIVSVTCFVLCVLYCRAFYVSGKRLLLMGGEHDNITYEDGRERSIKILRIYLLIWIPIYK